MSTLVLARRPARASVRIPGPGLFARILEHLVASRARQADGHIRLYLAQLPDATLDRIGLSPAETTALRAGRAINTSGLFSRDDGQSRRPTLPPPSPLTGEGPGKGVLHDGPGSQLRAHPRPVQRDACRASNPFTSAWEPRSESGAPRSLLNATRGCSATNAQLD